MLNKYYVLPFRVGISLGGKLSSKEQPVGTKKRARCKRKLATKENTEEKFNTQIRKTIAHLFRTINMQRVEQNATMSSPRGQTRRGRPKDTWRTSIGRDMKALWWR